MPTTRGILVPLCSPGTSWSEGASARLPGNLLAELYFRRLARTQVELVSLRRPLLEQAREGILCRVPGLLALLLAYLIDARHRIRQDDVVLGILSARLDQPIERLPVWIAVLAIGREHVGVGDDGF